MLWGGVSRESWRGQPEEPDSVESSSVCCLMSYILRCPYCYLAAGRQPAGAPLTFSALARSTFTKGRGLSAQMGRLGPCSSFLGLCSDFTSSERLWRSLALVLPLSAEHLLCLPAPLPPKRPSPAPAERPCVLTCLLLASASSTEAPGELDLYVSCSSPCTQCL